MAKPITYDRLKSKKKPTIKKVWIALDPEIAEAEAVARLRKDAAEIRMRGARSALEGTEEPTATQREDVVKAENEFAEKLAEHEALMKDLRENAVCFKFRALGRHAYQDLLNAHPATDEQRAAVKEEDPDATVDWNADTFPDALIAASLLEPAFTEEQVMEMLSSDDWSTAEVLALFDTALTANAGRQLVNLGNG